MSNKKTILVAEWFGYIGSHIIAKVLKGEIEELKVYGDDYDSKNGTAVRDYIYVTDLAKAHLRALDRLIEDSN